MLIATSRIPVKFKDARHCTVVSGEWFGVYTPARRSPGSQMLILTTDVTEEQVQ